MSRAGERGTKVKPWGTEAFALPRRPSSSSPSLAGGADNSEGSVIWVSFLVPGQLPLRPAFLQPLVLRAGVWLCAQLRGFGFFLLVWCSCHKQECRRPVLAQGAVQGGSSLVSSLQECYLWCALVPHLPAGLWRGGFLAVPSPASRHRPRRSWACDLPRSQGCVWAQPCA